MHRLGRELPKACSRDNPRGCAKLPIRAGMLRYWRVPKSAICRVTGHSPQLIAEHLALVETHFATEEALTGYLANRGRATSPARRCHS